MTKKWIYSSRLFLLILVFIGCDRTQIDNDIRVLITGNVIDQSNVPISNAHIEVYTDTNSSLSDRVLVGEGFSDDLGNFSVTSLFGGNDLFYILISAGTDYATYRYQTSTEEYTPDNLLFDLDTVELAQTAIFNYSIIRGSAEDTTLDYSFRYIEPSCLQIFEEGILNENATDCYEVKQLSGQLNNLVPDVEDRVIIVPLDSQVEFSYSINQGESISQIININTIEYAFQFNY